MVDGTKAVLMPHIHKQQKIVCLSFQNHTWLAPIEERSCIRFIFSSLVIRLKSNKKITLLKCRKPFSTVIYNNKCG